MAAAPPPLKKSPPARKKKGGEPPPSLDDLDVPSPPMPVATSSSSADGDEDATQGEWLFKQDDMVLGPVAAMVLVDRIKQGELTADTPIARDGQPFKPMKLVPFFLEAHQAMLAKKRREEEEREFKAKVRNAKVARVFLVLLIVLVPAGAGAFAGHTVMRLQPWDKTAEWIAKAPPLVDLPLRPIEVKKEEPKPEQVASADTPEQERGEPEEKGSGGGRRKVARPDRDKADDKGKAPEEEKQTGPIAETLTNQQAVAPLQNAKDALKACFKAELESNPDVPSPVVLSYTITEEGKATNVNLDNRELRGRPVVECVRKAMAGLRWPRFSGERKNVSVPFKLSKPPKPGERPN
jgi:hypothetical protein